MRSSLRVHGLLTLLTWGCLSLAAAAQTEPAGPPPPDMITGKVKEVVTKGKANTLVITDEVGNDHSFPLTPKIELEIRAQGDPGFLAPGMAVKFQAVQSNDIFFGTIFSVYPQFAGKKPPLKVAKSAPMLGQSVNLHDLQGEIARWEDVPDGKYDLLHLKATGKNEYTVYMEPNYRVDVLLTDPKSIEAGQGVTITGRLAGSKFLAAKIVVETGKSLKGEEFLPTLTKKK
jgi:hypothetical protein